MKFLSRLLLIITLLLAPQIGSTLKLGGVTQSEAAGRCWNKSARGCRYKKPGFFRVPGAPRAPVMSSAPSPMQIIRNPVRSVTKLGAGALMRSPVGDQIRESAGNAARTVAKNTLSGVMKSAPAEALKDKATATIAQGGKKLLSGVGRKFLDNPAVAESKGKAVVALKGVFSRHLGLPGGGVTSDMGGTKLSELAPDALKNTVGEAFRSQAPPNAAGAGQWKPRAQWRPSLPNSTVDGDKVRRKMALIGQRADGLVGKADFGPPSRFMVAVKEKSGLKLPPHLRVNKGGRGADPLSKIVLGRSETLTRDLNCGNCAIAVDNALRTGESFQADHGKVMYPDRIKTHLALKNEKSLEFDHAVGKDMFDEKLREKGMEDGARGIILMHQNGRETGHYINYRFANGKLELIDGQAGRYTDIEGYDSFQIMRTNP